MRINADINSMEINGGRMQIEHQGQSAYFTFSTFKRDIFGDDNDVFKHINLYWSQQSESFQQAVFNIYKEIEDCFDDIFSKDELTEKLKESVSKLVAMHPYKQLRNWTVNRTDLQVPAAFEKVYKEDPDLNKTTEKTYLYDDYRDLMALSFQLRLMVPIWASYVRHIRSQTGNGLKELQAFRLLERTEIPTLPAMEKLHTYIRANIRKENNTVVPVNFISEYDQPYWILCLLCVRKICTGNLQLSEPRNNLVTLVSNFIRIKTMYNDNDFQNRVHIKGVNDSSSGDENKISTMESIRTNTEISLEEAQELQFSVEDIHKVADKVFPWLPSNLLEDALASSSQLMANPDLTINCLLPPQRMLMAWTLKKAIPPMGIDFLEKHIQIQCMALTQAVLWFKGHQYLALLSTAYARKSDTNMHLVSSSAGKSRVTDDMINELRVYFPHVRMIVSRKAPSKESCFVMNDIDATCQDLSNSVWRATASDELFHQCLGQSNTRQIPILPDIRIRLTQLAIDVGSGRLFQ